MLSLGGGAPGPLTNLNGEIFTPGYLFDENGQLAERPEILDAPHLLADGQDFQITVDDAASIGRLTLVKYGAVTHSFNPEARMIDLSFSRGPDGKLNVDLPDNENVVTPGYWMLFAFNNKGTPSVAATIHVAPGGVYSATAAGTLMSLSGIAEVGAMMSQARVDLSQDFAISFDAYLGANDRGGEGLAFLLHNDPNGANAEGRGGKGLGASGIRDGIGFEIDTAFSKRAGDIRSDHANFFDTDAPAKRAGITNAVDLGNVEDGRWHTVQLSWDADTRTLVTSFDGIASSALSRDIVQEYLGGSDFAYFGFTGATGKKIANAQQIQVNSVQAVYEDPNPPISDGPFNVADQRGHVTLNGNASYLGSSGFRLTSEAGGESGNIMSNERISLAHDFSISFDVFLGAKNRGTDGMAFVLHNDWREAGATGEGGRGLGAAGIVNGLAIEFDTFNNGRGAGDIRADHAAFVDTDGGFMPLARPINLRNVEDNRWHTVNVTWDVETQTLGFTFDGNSSLSSSITRDLANDFFGGADSVHFGWTATTGGVGNRQMVNVTALDAVFDLDGGPMTTATYFDHL